jgi:hypothetical protein
MQSFNGAVLQLGWEDAGIHDSTVRGLDVVAAEWYWTGGNVTVSHLSLFTDA